ncbi:uncharacterized protein LOC134726698 [Mytilus trossulus]|uniref:uncharacterized protein LOC134726698 n=1 Tax=Mytilus trossulus TaxID=6551 RepID=UPI0030066F28
MAYASTSKQDDSHDSNESDSDELSLSCGSSEFEIGENGSSGSDEELEEATEHPDTACITDHPGFHPVCLDIHVLKVAYYQYRQQYGEHPDHGNETLSLSMNIFYNFRRNRYTAYRQFVQCCWHFLGKEVRVVIPSCVVLKIRTVFRDLHQNYTGFHEADSD